MTFSSYIIVEIDVFQVKFGIKLNSWSVMGKEIIGAGLSYW